MTTVYQPRRCPSDFFHHRPRSSRSRSSRSESPIEEVKHPIFEGTDAVAQNRRVAVQRIVEVHDALELKIHKETTSSEASISPSSLPSDQFTIDFGDIPFPDAEVRTFRYFLRKWDPQSSTDTEFDEAISPTRLEFEEVATKHFFRRITLWDEGDETKSRSRLTKERKKDKRISALGKLWMVEKQRSEHNTKDDLKEITTREGLAQLLWTLLNDQNEPLAPELFQECREAVKQMYGIKG